jgi:alpha-L-fucosidase
MKTKLSQSFALFLTLAFVAVLTYGCCTKHVKHAPKLPAMTKLPPPLPTPASQDEKMAWFRDAKFGLFIHWGLYCIPAGEWNG